MFRLFARCGTKGVSMKYLFYFILGLNVFIYGSILIGAFLEGL